MRGVRLVVMVALAMVGCSSISEAELDARMDLDGDGVSRPDDCDDDDPAVGAAESLFFDSDGDGYGSLTPAESCSAVSNAVSNSDDCDDNDELVYPGAEESCDGKDGDCNGTVDDVDDPPEWYLDADGDGYGSGLAGTLAACEQPSGYVDNGDDCDDLNAGAFPDTKEVCDDFDVDEDCSGAADDDDPNVDPETQVTTYQDEDGDGFGVDEVTALACDAGDGWALEGGDCDDADAERHPDTLWYWDDDVDGYGADGSSVRSCMDVAGYVTNNLDCDDGREDVNPGMTEICDDADADEDCDGRVEDEDDDPGGRLTYYEDMDGDGYGVDGSATDYCDAPSGWVLGGGDCDDAEPAVTPDPDAEELCNDKLDNDCNGNVDCDDPMCSSTTYCGYYGLAYSDLVLTGSSSSYDGYAVDAIEDCDGDGIGDLLVGALGSSALGAVYVVSGALTGTLDMSSTSIAWYTAENPYDYAGQTASSVGDLDSDGVPELVIGAPFDSETGSSDGAAYIVYGPHSGTVSLGLADAKILGGATGSLGLGYWEAAASDLTADGIDDIFVYGDGSFHVVPGGTLGTWSIDDVTLGQLPAYSESITILYDVDGTGVDSVLAGMSANDRAYLYYGPVTASGTFGYSATLTMSDSGSSSGFGSAVCGGGDLDGDGLEDLLVGAPSADDAGTNAGMVYLYCGPGTGTATVSAARASFSGELAGDEAGTDVAIAEDINGDGAGDLLVGAPGAWMGSAPGKVHLVLGPISAGSYSLANADAVLEGRSAGDQAGAVLDIGDADGDGLSDILVGAWQDSGGAAFFLLGSNF